jgi:hypothetical protein
MDLMNAVISKEKKERKHLVAALPKLVKDIAKAVAGDTARTPTMATKNNMERV